MCHEEWFFQRWTRRRTQERQRADTKVEHSPPVKEPRKPIAPAAAPSPQPRKEVEREVEIV